MDELCAYDLVHWWAVAGIDVAFEEAPRNRLAKTSCAKPPVPPRQEVKNPSLAPTEDVVAQAQSLEDLARIMREFEGCALKKTATQMVFADGTPGAPVMIVGEAPGAEEDKLGRPFVGRAGQLLDRMLASIGLDRSRVYITNVVPWRPPGNRTPTLQETALCLPFITRHIALARPKILMTMGNPATQALLNVKEGITRVRGTWHRYEIVPGGPVIPALPTLHPAYLLRTPAAKRYAWADLLALQKVLEDI